MKCAISTSLILITLPLIAGYGFDGGSSCSPKASRHGRAQMLATIPCDLSIQSYCNLPGKQYPWHAVRRFVHENQGLMRRMYGDVRHISILRTEINNNDIELDDVVKAATRYSRSGWKKNKYLYASDFQSSKTNDVLTEPHFRPASTSTTTSTTTKATTITTSDLTTSATPMPSTTNLSILITTKSLLPKSELSDNVDLEFASESVSETTANDKQNTISFHESSIGIFENITPQTTNINGGITENEPIKIVQSPNLTNNHHESESATISTTLRINLPSAKISEPSITPPQDDDAPTTSSTTTNDDDNLDEIKYSDHTTEQLQNKDATENYGGQKSNSFEANNNLHFTASASAKQSNKNVRPTEHTEGQLFQDAVDKEIPVTNNRGVNACPVKEEVVAPFWANNTRGEVLALLNLYPFEQYVHWEKCTSEHKQMYCREGCRCEQQYRLHRLLAYDPHNECRGIFSDWFRFPSCCICKCYDIPLEYRVTSRSPRSMMAEMEKHPVDAAYEEIQRAMYEHAINDDWYRRNEYSEDDDRIDNNDWNN